MPRKELDGARLADDVARLASADEAAPPQTRPSLMDAVRQLSTFVETRATLRWSSAAIAAVLTEAGYAIDAATLRSYRSRLRAEAGATPTSIGEPLPSPVTPPAPLSMPASNDGPAVKSSSSSRPPQAAPPGRAPPAASPGGETTLRRPFRIDRSTIPSDRG